MRNTENPINVKEWITAAQSTGSEWVENQWICQLTGLVKEGWKKGRRRRLCFSASTRGQPLASNNTAAKRTDRLTSPEHKTDKHTENNYGRLNYETPESLERMDCESFHSGGRYYCYSFPMFRYKCHWSIFKMFNLESHFVFFLKLHRCVNRHPTQVFILTWISVLTDAQDFILVDAWFPDWNHSSHFL